MIPVLADVLVEWPERHYGRGGWSYGGGDSNGYGGSDGDGHGWGGGDSYGDSWGWWSRPHPRMEVKWR